MRWVGVREPKTEILGDGRISWTVELSGLEHDELGFVVEAPTGWVLSQLSDAALVGLLMPCMQQGLNIRFEGPVNERLLLHARGPLQAILRRIFPNLHTVEIEAAGASTSFRLGHSVMAGFSSGVDSWSLVGDHLLDPHDQTGSRLTHLLFNDVGSHGSGESGRQLFLQRLGRVRSASESLGIPLIVVRSNLDQLYGGLLFEDTHTLRNATVPLILAPEVGSFMYASTFPLVLGRVGVRAHIGYSDPWILPLLGPFSSVGGQRSRIEKTKQISRIPQTFSNLDVCTRLADGNCSQCRKCLMTMFTLEICGALDSYEDVFDLGKYQRAKRAFLATVLVSRHPLEVEVRRFARFAVGKSLMKRPRISGGRPPTTARPAGGRSGA